MLAQAAAVLLRLIFMLSSSVAFQLDLPAHKLKHLQELLWHPILFVERTTGSLWLLSYVTPKGLIWFGDVIYFRYLNQSVSAESDT